MGDRVAAQRLIAQAEESVKANTQATNDHAYQLASSAAFADPTWGEGFYKNGNIACDLNKPEAAIACYRRALECEMEPEMKGMTLSNLGWQLHLIGKTREAHDILMQAVDVAPKLALPWLHLSTVHGTLDQTETAVSCARKLVELSPPGDALAEFGLSFALLFNRQFKEGLKAFEARFTYRLKQYLHYPWPKWKGEDGKTVFLVADQGLGDTLSYARFVDRAAKRARYLHLCIQPELRRVFEHAFMHLPNINFLPTPTNFPGDCDAWTTFVSLPYALGLSDHEYINQPGIDIPRWPINNSWKVPDRKLHVGIAWAGSPQNDIDKHRNVSITQFLDLYRVPGIQLYSLQVDGKKGELYTTGGAPVIKDLTGYVRDCADTFSILQNLDLVVTIESALGHIAGAANVPCVIPYSWLGRDYRAGATGESPLWYKKHKFFRQSDDRQWQGPFDRIVEYLKEWPHGN